MFQDQQVAFSFPQLQFSRGELHFDILNCIALSIGSLSRVFMCVK